MIKVAGFQTNSFIDYPGKIASVVFLGGCNFRCFYCHNAKLFDFDSNYIPFDETLSKIKEQIGFIDGVVITGGEPTLHPQLEKMISEIHKLGLKVKLDSNGANPRLLKKIVNSGMIDYVAMDVKAPLAKYGEIAGVDKFNDGVLESIKFLIGQEKVDYMFRTTLAPKLTEKDMREMAKMIAGAKCFQLQQFVPNEFSNSHPVINLPYSKDVAEKFASLFKKNISNVLMRGFD